MARYASETSVSPDQSMLEIKSTLERYGASKFAFMEEVESVHVVFEAHSRRVRFTMPLPRAEDYEHNRTGAKMGKTQAKQAHKKAVWQRWRALLLTIKAKLESVESGIETFEDAFMAQLVLPSGQTMGEWVEPQIRQIYDGGQMPPLLLGGGG